MGGLLARAPRPAGVSPGGAAPAVLRHYARHALSRRPHALPAQHLVHLGRPVYPAACLVGAAYQAGQLRVPLLMGAGCAGRPRVVALARHLERGAHLGHAVLGAMGVYEPELRPLRLAAYSCLLAKKALAFKSISFSLLRRSFSRLSLFRSSAIWKGLSAGAAPAASAFLTHADTLPASTPSSRPIWA